MKAKSSNATLSWLRARLQSSGVTYYYFEIPNSRPRQEIPLGNDRQSALAKRKSLLIRYISESQTGQSTDIVALNLYMEVEVPKFQMATQIENSNAIKRLLSFLRANEHFSKSGQEIDLLTSYQDWIGIHLKIRARSDIAFFNMVLKSVSKWP